ncbi:MAG: type IV pilus biogenesis protein PilM [Polyangiales bacterium]
MARFLGIDVGTTALRGTLIRSALRKLEVERYVEIPLVEQPGSPGHLAELGDAGRNLLRALPAAPDVIVAAMPGEEVSLRMLELPGAARKRIAEILPFELEALLPYDPHDAVYDHQPASAETGGGAAGVVNVLAASVLPTHVSALLDRLKLAGLEPRELAAGAAALDGLCSLLPELRAAGIVLLVDLGDHRTDLCFLRAGMCVFARTIAIGIEDMPGAAADAQHELQRTLASFRGAGFEAPSRVLLSGPGAIADGAAAWIASALGVREVTPLGLPTPTVAQTLPSPAFGLATALAARGAMGRRRINLRKGAFATTDTRGEVVEQLSMIVTCVVLVVMTAMFSLKMRQMLLSDEQQALKTELASVTKEVFGHSITEAAPAIQLAKNPRWTDPLPRFDAYDAVEAVSAAVAPSISHEVRRLSVEVADEKREGRMELQGVLDSLVQRDEIVSALEKHPCFHDIQLGRTSPGNTDNKISYQIEATVQCPGDGSAESKGKKKSSEGEP